MKKIWFRNSFYIYIFPFIVLIFFIVSFQNVSATSYTTIGIPPWTMTENGDTSNFEVCIEEAPVPAAESVVLDACYNFDSVNPKFVWSFGNDPSSGTNAAHNLVSAGTNQGRFQIEVDSTSPFSLPNDYDSGWLDTSAAVLESGGNPSIYSYTPPAANLLFETTYSWRIIVEDDSAETVNSGWIVGNDFEVLQCVPSAPSDILITWNDCHQLTITWTDNTANGDGFRVQKRMDSNRDGDFSDEAWGAYIYDDVNATFIDIGAIEAIVDGEDWQYQVFSYNEEGPSTSDTDDMSIPLCPPTMLAATESLACTVGGLWPITVNWSNNSSNATDNEIWRDTGGGWALFNTVDPTTSSQADSIPLGTTYTYRVRAINTFPTALTSFWTPDVNGLGITARTMCDPIISPIATFNCDCVTVVWATTGAWFDVDHYDLYRTTLGNPQGDVTDEMVNTADIPNNQFMYNDCDIDSGAITYTYTVRSCLDATCLAPNFLDSDPPENIIAPCMDLPTWLECN